MQAKHTPYFNLLEALAQPGCALCRLSLATIERFLDGMLYESVNDAEMQQRLIAGHGFCPAHSRQLLQKGGALGTSILYNVILKHLLAELPRDKEKADKWLDRARRYLAQGGSESLPAEVALPWQPHQACLVCQRRDQTADRALAELRQHYQDQELITAVQNSDGFCLPHLQRLLSAVHGPARQLVLARQRRVWETLRAQLAEFIRKNDYRFQQEGFGEERDAWQRAVRATSGEPGVF